MKKLPITYNDQVVGYVDDTQYDENGNIEKMFIYLFKCDLYDDVLRNIKKSCCLTMDNNINFNDIERNRLFDFEINDYLIIIKRIIS